MTDPIADMLARIRNAVSAKHSRVDIPASKLKLELRRSLIWRECRGRAGVFMSARVRFRECWAAMA